MTCFFKSCLCRPEIWQRPCNDSDVIHCRWWLNSLCLVDQTPVQVVTSVSGVRSPPASDRSVTATAKPSSAGRIINFVKNAVGVLLPSVVLPRSLSPTISSPATNRHQATDKRQPINQSQYVTCNLCVSVACIAEFLHYVWNSLCWQMVQCHSSDVALFALCAFYALAK